VIRAALCALAIGAVRTVAAQGSPDVTAHAESLRAAGRPWHAAEALLTAAARDVHPRPALVVAGARAELAARRYDRAASLLIGQPWLATYGDGEPLALLAQAEAHLGRFADAARDFGAARARASGARAAMLAVRQALAFEGAGAPDSAAPLYAAARRDLPAIGPWLALREAAVTRDTVQAFRLLDGAPPGAGRAVLVARARALLASGDSADAFDAFRAAGRTLDAARLALARGDTARGRAALYDLMARAPESDPAAAAVPLVWAAMPPVVPAERIALAHTLKLHGAAGEARREVGLAVQAGDSSGATLLFYGELLAGTGRLADAADAYRAAARDSAVAPLALYRRARMLVALHDPGATEALSAFAQAYPSDTAAPTALYLAGDAMLERGDSAAASGWFGELFRAYPADPRASLARFRLAVAAYRARALDSAAALWQGEIAAGGPQRIGARFWLARVALARGDTAAARDAWTALARDDSVGYYGLRARSLAGLGPPVIAAAPLPDTPAMRVEIASIDTLLRAGLDSEAADEVRSLLARPPESVDDLLAASGGVADLGFGPAAVRLAWQAAAKSPNDARVLRAIFLWPNRAAVEAEAREFGVDPYLFVAIVRQESVFDVEALSGAGAHGLAQLLLGTAASTARGLDVPFDPAWIDVPDLNLHLGAAHLAELLRRFGGREEVAAAAYNAGPIPAARWLSRPGAEDPDQFIELIPYQETRGYVRAVLRNRVLYRVLYSTPAN